MATIDIEVPQIMRADTKGQSRVSIDAADVRTALGRLVDEYPGLKPRIFNQSGEIHRFLGIYLADRDIRFADGLDTVLREGDKLLLTSAVAGG